MARIALSLKPRDIQSQVAPLTLSMRFQILAHPDMAIPIFSMDCHIAEWACTSLQFSLPPIPHCPLTTTALDRRESVHIYSKSRCRRTMETGTSKGSAKKTMAELCCLTCLRWKTPALQSTLSRKQRNNKCGCMKKWKSHSGMLKGWLVMTAKSVTFNISICPSATPANASGYTDTNAFVSVSMTQRKHMWCSWNVKALEFHVLQQNCNQEHHCYFGMFLFFKEANLILSLSRWYHFNAVWCDQLLSFYCFIY